MNKFDLTSTAPPADLPPPKQALWWLAKGGFRVGEEWERAHAITQTAEGTPAYDWVHALIHRIEGDLSNANYWYRRAGKASSTADFAVEAEEIAAQI